VVIIINKTLIFDFDGTLADSTDLTIEIYNSIAKKRGYKKANIAEIHFLKQLSISEICKYFCIPLFKLPSLFVELSNTMSIQADKITPVKGLFSELKTIKENNNNLYIISSNSIQLINNFLILNNLNFFNEVYSSKNLFGKNVVIDKFISRTKLNREDIFYIGDEVRDIVAARKSRVKIISVTWGYNSYDLLKKESPDFLINEPSELINIISN
jgi:phosphoglycolate phosphatase